MAEGNIEQEIANLEQRLAEKRRALETADDRGEKEPSDKELVHEVVGEKIQEQMPAYQSTPVPSSSGDSDASWQDPAIAQQVQSLVNIAFTKSLDEAIGEAIKSRNPAIIDAFHDLLRDQLMAELIKRGKIQPLSAQ